MSIKSTHLVAEDFLPAGVPMLPPAGEEEKHRRVLQVVKRSVDGASTGSIAEAVGITGPTALKILRELEREREVYSRSHTKRAILIWYANGRLVHPYLELYRELRGKSYRVSVQEGRSGPTVQIQERAYSLLTGERIEGAVFVDYASIDELIDLLQDIKKRYESLDNKQFLKELTKSESQ